jgi:hypothetical protein
VEAIGHAEEVIIGKDSITANGVISFESEAAKKVITAAKNGFEWQASIGAAPVKTEYIKENQKVTVNGKVFEGPLVVALKSKLREISFVDLGADENTSVSVAAHAEKENAMTVKELLAKLCGGNKALLGLLLANAEKESWTNEQAQAEFDKITASFKPVVVEKPEVKDEVGDELRVKAVAEISRISAINALAEKFGPKYAHIHAKAVAEKWTAEKAEVEFLRASTPSTPAIIIGKDNHTPEVIEAALCLKQGLKIEANTKPEVLDHAHKMRNLGLRDMIRFICASAGVELPMGFGTDWIRAAFSTAAVPGILGNVANKALGASFGAFNAVSTKIAKAVSLQNFYQQTVYQLSMSGDLEQVAPNGELKHLSLSEESYNRKVDTRGALVRISRQDMKNDSIGAFLDMATRLGRNAARSREKVAFGVVNATGAGSSFFTSANKNYLSGAGSVLGVDGLTAAVKAFRELTDPDGNPLGLEPKILLVPPALETTAKRLVTSQAMIASSLGSTSSRVVEPSGNIFNGAFQVEVSPFLNTGSGGLDTTWYLLADPMDVAALELAYLDGNQSPIVEFFGLESDLNTLGVAWRAYFDFGANLAEYRAGVKSRGA